MWMVSQTEIDRLRLEADTIMTRYQQVEEALIQARPSPVNIGKQAN